MAVKLSKEESVKKINLRKDTLVNLTKSNPILSNLRSRVGVVLDYSGSMGKFYRDGDIQRLLEVLIPIALKFDDNGALDFWIFEDGFHRIGEVNMSNFYGFIENEILRKYNMGCTRYAPVINDVYQKYVFEEPATYPSYVMFITDGDCSDGSKAKQMLVDNSRYNVFWQFIGMGRGPFHTLEELDDLTGRFIDNADFFQVKDLINMPEDELYKKLMTEYPGYLQEAVVKNIVTLENKEKVKENSFMAVNLSKGGKVSLAKVAADAGITGGLSKIVVGLGWDTNRYDGGGQFDLDAAAFMQGASGKVRSDDDFIFYNKKSDAGNWSGTTWVVDETNSSILHTGDNRTGEGDGDDEQIKIDLTKVPADVQKIAFTVTIDQADVRNQSFGMVENSYVHILDEATGTELIRYDLGEDFSIETAIVVAELYRHNGEWKFNAVGSGFSGGLAALCKNFGVDV